jgi:hypothetical protein
MVRLINQLVNIFQEALASPFSGRKRKRERADVGSEVQQAAVEVVSRPPSRLEHAPETAAAPNTKHRAPQRDLSLNDVAHGDSPLLLFLGKGRYRFKDFVEPQSVRKSGSTPVARLQQQVGNIRSLCTL